MNISTLRQKTIAFSAILTLFLLPARGQVGTTSPDAAKSIAQGVEWLAQQQKEDGSFSNPQFPGLSGLALWAIAASGNPAYSNVVKKGSDFLISKVQKDGGIYVEIPGRKGGGLGTYNTAICLMALAETHRKDLTEIVLNARTYLAESQHIGDDVFSGGFGYDKQTDRAYTDLMNTHFVVEAMRRTQSYEDLRPVGNKHADVNWKAALDFVESLHNGKDTGDNAGGFFYSPGDAKAGTDKRPGSPETTGVASKEDVILRSYGSITYAGLLSLVYCKVDKTDTRVQSALDWASKHWTLEENPGMGQQGLYFFYNVLSRSLSTVGTDSIKKQDGTTIQWKDALVAKVTSLMHEDGSWVNQNGRFWENDPVLATSFAVLSLEFVTGKNP